MPLPVRNSLLVLIIAGILFSAFACKSSDSGTAVEPGSAQTAAAPVEGVSPEQYIQATGHMKAIQSIIVNPATGQVEILQERSVTTHLDLAWFWKYYPNMLKVKMLDFDPGTMEFTIEITFTNPIITEIRDVRCIFPKEGNFLPLTIDGWSVRAGADISDPDPFFGFGREFPNRAIQPLESDTRQIVFKPEPQLSPYIITFVLDATVENNTAESYEFGQPKLTGRYFQMAVSDWQDDITSVFLDVTPCGWPVPLRLAKFENHIEWGTSVPDLDPGNYRLLVITASPESEGEIGEGESAFASHWINFKWPPDDPIIPLPRGQGIYAYSLIDPDTNLPPTDAELFMNKFRNEMGGDFLILEYGEICNSGYLAMHDWVPIHIGWMQAYAPDLPIHLNFDNIGFPEQQYDPCMHPPEYYSQDFFDNLLDSIRGQVLDNPVFDNIEGLHFDIEVIPQFYDETELFNIYNRYGEFLARLHLEPDLNGRVITIYEFDWHPCGGPDDLPYLSTTDAFFAECYYSRFTWLWNPDKFLTPFLALYKEAGTYQNWSEQHGRPFYPIAGTFSGWIDLKQDTLGSVTICGDFLSLLIDEHCFGKGPFNTINEFDIVRDSATHGMVVEKVILELPSGEPIFPASGFAVYLMGDGDPETESDDTIFCRTAYSTARTIDIFRNIKNDLIPGFVTFRYENNLEWKAAGLNGMARRRGIGGISGRIRFGDGLSLQLHPELWGGITIELMDSDILDNPVYRSSIDIVGVEDGSYLFPDLPLGNLTIRAVADGWSSDPVTVILNDPFAYQANVDLILNED